jgi:cardiolipin-specific phospholipase
MDPAGGRASLEELKRAGNFKSRMFMIQGAGHHGEYTLSPLLRVTHTLPSVYMDNVKAVNNLIVRELDRALELQ